MTAIQGLEGLTLDQLEHEVRSGARFVIYQYAISLLVLSLRRSSRVYFLRSGESGAARGASYSLLTALLGWWGIPWGPILSIQALATNLGGGKDVTAAIMADLRTSVPQRRVTA